MKFKEITFKDQDSKRLYKDYLNRIQKSTKILNQKGQEEILLEINSHIYESLKVEKINDEGSEAEQLQKVLDKLGQPEVILRPLIAEKKMVEATKTFNPIKVASALLLNIGNGISYIVFAILYILLFVFGLLIIAKIIFPKKVGFFYHPNEVFILGMQNDSIGIDYQQYEQLGYWFIPLMFLFIILFYLILTILLKFKQTLKKQISL